MNKKRIMEIILVIGIILMILAGYLYYKQEISENKRNQKVSDTTAEEGVNPPLGIEKDEETKSNNKGSATTEEINQEASTTAEKKQNKKLPNNYEWDEKRWGEPPQIIYDFAENQDKFDFIVKEVDSLLSEGEGFTTRRNNEELYSKSENGERLKKDIDYLLNNTLFYKFIKEEYGYWIMEYDQEEDRHIYIYAMRYIPRMTEEEAWDNGYIKVVGNWYFAPVWI